MPPIPEPVEPRKAPWYRTMWRKWLVTQEHLDRQGAHNHSDFHRQLKRMRLMSKGLKGRDGKLVTLQDIFPSGPLMPGISLTVYKNRLS